MRATAEPGWIWRWLNPAPVLPGRTPRWQRILAHVSHGALYALILMTPLFGWMMSSARNFPVSWFGVFTFPDLVAPDQARYRFFHEAHELLAWTLLVLAAVHAVAALKHHFIDRDDVLLGMLPTWLKLPRK